MNRSTSFARRHPALVGALLFVGLLAGPSPRADDIDLLRFDTAKPYVFLILDTSTSMNLGIDGGWVHANGDDPRSKLYAAKNVLYDVLSDVSDVHFGFATYNQDALSVRAKHWLYSVADLEANHNAIAGLPIAYPAIEPGDEIDVPALDDDGEPTGDIDVRIDGDLWTLGQGIGVPGGACDAPLALGNAREKINRYPKLGAAGDRATPMWVRDGGRTYQLTFSNVGGVALGAPRLIVDLRVRQLASGNGACTADFGNPRFVSDTTARLELLRYRSFLLWGDTSSKVHLVPGLDQSKHLEDTGGYWPWRDVVGTYHCGDDKPFSGHGWEGNYDTGALAPDPGLEPPLGIQAGKVDTVCDPTDPSTCFTLKQLTLRSTGPDLRELDRGDLLPFHWQFENKEAFLGRINPRHASGGRAFDAASYFEDLPVVAGANLAPRRADERPLIAAGNSPLSDAIVDFRCWYLANSANKCRDLDNHYARGYSSIADEYDPEWLCRKPYLIVITDGENNCSGENPTADVANLFSKALVRTWVVNLGANNPGVINSLVNPGNGEEVTVEDRDGLRRELERILGIIREESRGFASAAVPSVQADVSDKVYLTQFTPLNGHAVWDGHLRAFRKPVPIDPDTGFPDNEHENHIWDAGTVVRDQQAPRAAAMTLPVDASMLRAGPADDQRRILYPADPDASAGVPLPQSLLVPPTGADAPARTKDLWRGLGLVEDTFEIDDFTTTDELFERHPLEATAFHKLLRDTYVVRSAEVEQTDGSFETVEFVLGDVFHADPLVIAEPPNVSYFVNDADFPGYRRFATKHNNRRRVALIGANDGMLHGFDAGQFETQVVGGQLTGRFDDGTGAELFAFLPRTLMPNLRAQAPPSTTHQWGVDGSPRAADVLVDPHHGGTPRAEDREWRTVVVGGLRRGGRAVYALDVTQPDSLHAVTHTDETGLEQTIDFVPKNTVTVPDCQTPGAGGDYGCHPELPYPAVLWEFTDDADEDENGAADLGETWSTPNIGAVRVLERIDGELRETLKFVAMMGGGRDPDGLSTGGAGNWLYMIDVETGKALYKRPLIGAVPAEPAAVDTNQDGVLDRIYVGTAEGYVYRVDLTEPPPLVDTAYGTRVADGWWDPYPIFDTVTAVGGVETRRPIYFRPSVFFVASLNRYGLSFGTGNRDDLFVASPAGGNRVYVMVDDDLGAITPPLTETDLVPLAVGDPNLGDNPAGTEADLLLDRPVGSRGWFLALDGPNERVITSVFSLSGITLVSTFLPEICDPTVDGVCREPEEGGRCAKRGNSRIYLLMTTNGDGVFRDFEGRPTRYQELPGVFLTEPYVEQFQTQNQPPDGDGPVAVGGSGLTEAQQEILEALKKLFPANCRFGNYRMDLKTIQSDTKLVFIAPVPVCIVQKNWKEF